MSRDRRHRLPVGAGRALAVFAGLVALIGARPAAAADEERADERVLKRSGDSRSPSTRRTAISALEPGVGTDFAGGLGLELDVFQIASRF